ncbi:alpha-amylase [Hamadaea tsunoensis]|uniref:alpha-amylase n=1 Tax=Hamadaea tsunoensis TaxID=53368 RepID=UPI000410E4ED|nr:alpha-amylase family protein [Hamadaea tsunoensis]
MRRWRRGAFCALLLVLTGCSAEPLAVPAATKSAVPADGNAPTGVVVHLFEWPWASVAKECTDRLGPAGVAAVQISPPQEHVELPDQHFPWWQDYQPVSYALTSRRGDRAALADMVATCHKAGVRVYADAVLNHMTAQLFGVGSAGTKFTKTGYPGYDGSADFHHCGHDIADYTDRDEVQNCDLVGLADLATERADVRAKLAAYLGDLLSLGVDGFRIDAAKHMPAADIAAILGKLGKTSAGRVPVIYQEVLFAAGEPIQPAEYLPDGAVLEPRYGPDLSRAMRGSLVNLEGLGEPTGDALDYEPSGQSVVYVDSHDTQRGGTPLTYKDGALHTLATAFMLAYPYGTPLVMSSFAFDDYDQGPPAAKDGTTLPVVCAPQAFVCEHRTVLPLVRFRAVTGDAPVTHWWAADDQLGFAREGKGYFALNRAAQAATRSVATGLPAGTYHDITTGSAVTVDGSGQATITVPAQGTLALVAG